MSAHAHPHLQKQWASVCVHAPFVWMAGPHAHHSCKWNCCVHACWPLTWNHPPLSPPHQFAKPETLGNSELGCCRKHVPLWFKWSISRYAITLFFPKRNLESGHHHFFKDSCHHLISENYWLPSKLSSSLLPQPPQGVWMGMNPSHQCESTFSSCSLHWNL